MHTTPILPRKRGAAAILTTFGLAAGCFIAVPLAQFVDDPEPAKTPIVDISPNLPPPLPLIIPPEPKPEPKLAIKDPPKPPPIIPVIDMIPTDLVPGTIIPYSDPTDWIPKPDPIYLPGDMDSPPELVFQVTPNPRSQRTGMVQVKLIVDTSGQVSEISIMGHSDPVLEQACRQAVAKWRFKPGYVRGVPVRFQVIVPFQFKGR